ncbi:MAG: hypothetical protein GPJ52_00020 [Candidatus Heimdallarchaeota archaeon]|nr:hypothetical protein [Candidatus Heimdallarchaeota archaeon]
MTVREDYEKKIKSLIEFVNIIKKEIKFLAKISEYYHDIKSKVIKHYTSGIELLNQAQSQKPSKKSIEILIDAEGKLRNFILMCWQKLLQMKENSIILTSHSVKLSFFCTRKEKKEYHEKLKEEFKVSEIDPKDICSDNFPTIKDTIDIINQAKIEYERLDNISEEIKTNKYLPYRIANDAGFRRKDIVIFICSILSGFGGAAGFTALIIQLILIFPI